jgi:hypothetical protein
MQLKINPNIYLDMLLQAESSIKDRILAEKQKEVDEYNKTWCVKLGIYKKATLENYNKIKNGSFLNEVYWSEIALQDLQKDICKVKFVIKTMTTKDKLEVDDIEVSVKQLMYLDKFKAKE